MDYVPTSAKELRSVFNAVILPLIERGELLEFVLASRPAARWAGQPHGTLSEIVEYQRDGVAVALVHRFVLPDGELGGSGRPDPKMVLVDSSRLILDEAPPSRRL